MPGLLLACCAALSAGGEIQNWPKYSGEQEPLVDLLRKPWETAQRNIADRALQNWRQGVGGFANQSRWQAALFHREHNDPLHNHPADSHRFESPPNRLRCTL